MNNFLTAIAITTTLSQTLKVLVLSLLISLCLTMAMPHTALAASIPPSQQPIETMSVHLGNLID